MRLALGFTWMLALAALPAAADDRSPLPPDAASLHGPMFRPDALTIELRPAPTRAVSSRLAAGRPDRPRETQLRLGLPGVDAVSASLGGVRFAPILHMAPERAGAAAALESFFRVELPAGADLTRALAEFAAAPEVALAEPIPVVPVSSFPNDSLYPVSTWYFQSSRQDIHAPEAWALGLGDTSVVVGIMDTGVVPYHPDLGGTVAGLSGQIKTNWAERGGVPGVDDDGNGFIDDFAGWDFVSAASFGPFPAFEDTRDADNDPNDFAGHGTRVAGIVSAITDNAIGVSGTAPGVRLLPLRVGWSTSAFPSGLIDLSYCADALGYCITQGVSVVNCSFASPSSETGFGLFQSAISAAVSAGIDVIFAAGNSGQDSALCLRSDVVAVAAVDATDKIANFSLVGNYVDVSAPGVGIKSTAMIHSTSDSLGQRLPTYGQLDGTSFSAPMVAGGAALLESRRRALGGPKLTPRNLALRLWDTADDISAQNPGKTGFGGGRLNLERLLLDPPVSHAHRTGSRSTIANVALHTRDGSRIFWATNGGVLVGIDAVTGDTLARGGTVVSGTPRQVAAADLGGGRGIGIFVGTSGRMYGYDVHGAPLPGWPYFIGSASVQLNAGPALGDLDGDGVLEVVCGASNGTVWAWHADGTLLAGFPADAGASGIAGAVALADVDGLPGDEIVVAGLDGLVHAIRSDGNEVGGWPVDVSSPFPNVSPVVARFGASPAIVVAAGNMLHALRTDGTFRWSIAMSGTAVQDPALADFDGDGADEIVVPLTGPNSLAAFDTTGALLSARGWPALLPVGASGPPVIGPIASGVPQGTLVFCNGRLLAVNDHAVRLTTFPKSGGAGTAPTLDEFDGDGRTEIAAGTGSDSLFYVYDAGSGSWAAGAPWPTPRGDPARTGNHFAPRPLPVVDLTPPGTIGDLRPDSLGASGARFTFTAPGGDGAVGRAARYEVNVTTVRGDAGLFRPGSVRTDAVTPDPAGTAQFYRLTGLAPDVSAFVAVRAVDSTGNVGAASNVAHVLAAFGPLRPEKVPGLAPSQQPSLRPVMWEWRLSAAAGPARELRIFDLQGRTVRVLPVGAGVEGSETWDGRDGAGRSVPAGLYFARLTSGSFHAQSRVVLLP